MTDSQRRARLRSREVPLGAVPARYLERWRALAASAMEPNPFFEPDFVLAAADNLGERGLSLLVVEDEDGWRACLPVQRTRIVRVLPGLRTWNHIYCFLGTPLLHPRAARESAGALLELALAAGGRLLLEGLRDDGPAAETVRLAADDLGLQTLEKIVHERALLVRRPSADYLAGMRGHRRRELNRLGRRLAVELGGELAVSDCTADDSAPDRFLELERSGWKGRSETALASSPGHARLFRSVCRSFAADERLQMLALTVGERTVAMKCNLYAGEGGFCFKIAYDEKLAHFSPGVQLERENVRRFHEDRDELWQDSCADPQNDMINSLWPDRRRISSIVLARRGARSTVSRHGIRAARAVRRKGSRRSSRRS